MKITLLFFIVACLSQADAQFSNFFLSFFCQQNNSSLRLCQNMFTATQPRTRSTATPPRITTTTSTTSTGICHRIGGRCTEGKFLADIFIANLIASGSSSSGNSGRTTTNNGGSRAPGGGMAFGQPSGIPLFPALTSVVRPSSYGGGNRAPSGGGLSAGPQFPFLYSGLSVPPRFPGLTSGNRSSLFGGGGGRTLTALTAAPCVTRNIIDQRGNVLAGACVTPSSGGRGKRQAYRPVQTKNDILIMMDESGSVGSSRFAKVKRIAAATIRVLCGNMRVHPSYTRVAVTSFDSTVHDHVRLVSPRQQSRLDYDSNALANHIINSIHYNRQTDGRTCLIDALQHAYSVALNKRYGGRRDNRDVEQTIILISDGCENCVRPTNVAHARIQAITARLIAENIHVFVIGISIDERCKETLNMLGQGRQCFHFFYPHNWDVSVVEFLRGLENPTQGSCLNAPANAQAQCVNAFG